MTGRAARYSCLALFLLSASAEAALTPDALTTIRHLAIQHQGRHKPFDSFARDAVRFLTGTTRRSSVITQGPVETVLSILAEPQRWQEAPLIAVPYVPLREALGLGPATTHVSYNELIATRALMKRLPAIVEKEQRDEPLSMLDHETLDVYQRFVLLNRLFEQDLELVPSPSVASPSWLSILKPTGYPPTQQTRLRDAWAEFLEALRDGSPQRIESSVSSLSTLLRAQRPDAYPAQWRLRLEVAYNRLGLFQLAQVAYLLAALGLLVGVRFRPWGLAGLGALWVGVLLHGGGIALRVILGGRPPVSNFYETMLWLPFVGVVLALIFERIYRARSFALAAAVLAGITLLLADHVPLDSGIGPVVAVLRSPLWLTVHVLTIVASYGALALAAVLAHGYGILWLVRGRTHPTLPSLETFLYRTIQVGVVLLAAGTMLGAVWANASWGRYWGWDPKETWALITLLWFIAALHGRFAGWLKDVGFALATIGGFFLLLMTYYGVSFYLVGLHSYAGGHAKPLPLLLVAYLVAELAFMAVVGASAMKPRRPA